MPSQHDQFSPADLLAAGVPLRPAEAVTIVREVIAQVLRGAIPGIPSLHVVRLSHDGNVTVEGPVAAGDREVSRAAYLLDGLLAPFDAPAEFRVPGPLRLVMARALRTLDLPPYQSLEAFNNVLARFAAGDAQETIRAISSRCASALEIRRNTQEPEEALVPVRTPPRPAAEDLTISDIRRARRATGLTLSDIARRSRIPVPLLRQLEWGYLVNWPQGPNGRTQLINYARAAGLDDEVVVQTVWPLVAEYARGTASAIDDAAASPVIVDADEVRVVTVGETVDGEIVQETPRRRRRTLVAALAIPALLALGVMPAVLERYASTPDGTPRSVEATEATRAVASPAARDTREAGVATRQPDSGVPHATGTSRRSPARAATPGEGTRTAAAGARDGRTARAVISQHDTFSPSFTNAGSAIFYHAKLQDRSALMRADTDGEGAILRITRIVDDNARNFHARPSPDGSLIAFDSDRDGDRAVYVAAADGRRVRRVSGDGFAAIPSWSPDGRTLAYVRAEPGRPRVWNLWTTELETGRTRRLTSYKYGQPWGGSWFPDGKRIAYSHEDRLIVLDTESGAERVHRTPVTGRLVRTPAVSPDGRYIVFQVQRNGAWLLNVSDGSMRKVLSDASAEEFTWAPDGRQVAYHSRRTGGWGVWIMGAR